MSDTTIDMTETDAAGGDYDIEVPDGWEVLSPPPGISLLAIDATDGPITDDGPGFRANLVVTTQPRVTDGVPTDGEIDDYLTTLLATLDEQLLDLEELGVWIAEEQPETPERLAAQRVLVAYRIDDATSEEPLAVEMMQQHYWLAAEIVTITATVPADADDAVIDTLRVCLESLTPVG